MEKTLARAIYKKMKPGTPYTTSELFCLVGDDYYKYIPAERHPGQPDGEPVNKVVAEEMWKVVKAGFAKTYKGSESLALVGGLRKGATPTTFRDYSFRYWVRTK